MSIKDANIWKSSGLKSLKTLFSSPQRVQASLFISDTGIISLQNIPMATGWVYLAEEKLSWMVDHRCYSTDGRVAISDDADIRTQFRAA